MIMYVLLTISPFMLIGGNHDTMTFVFDAGIAFMSAGADGTGMGAKQRIPLILGCKKRNAVNMKIYKLHYHLHKCDRRAV